MMINIYPFSFLFFCCLVLLARMVNDSTLHNRRQAAGPAGQVTLLRPVFLKFLIFFSYSFSVKNKNYAKFFKKLSLWFIVDIKVVFKKRRKKVAHLVIVRMTIRDFESNLDGLECVQ